jgi:NADH-quinone oxidoreductase subunit J
MVDWIVFLAGVALTLLGAVGVLVVRNPVHAALLLVQTLFGVAVLFVSQEAHFLAAVQVIVYAGAVVVLFLFVIMLLGVDREERDDPEVLRGQRAGAAVVGLIALVELLVIGRLNVVLGAPSVAGSASGERTNVEKISEVLFTRHLYAFEITSVLLVIAVVGAVLLARRARTPELPGGAS